MSTEVGAIQAKREGVIAEQPGAADVVKYRDPANTGNTYGGRGKRPDWLRKCIDQGRKLEEFAV